MQDGTVIAMNVAYGHTHIGHSEEQELSLCEPSGINLPGLFLSILMSTRGPDTK